jgi:hypothetical protein
MTHNVVLSKKQAHVLYKLLFNSDITVSYAVRHFTPINIPTYVAIIRAISKEKKNGTYVADALNALIKARTALYVCFFIYGTIAGTCLYLVGAFSALLAGAIASKLSGYMISLVALILIFTIISNALIERYDQKNELESKSFLKRYESIFTDSDTQDNISISDLFIKTPTNLK